MKLRIPTYALLAVFALLLTACGKGYQVRVTNYYTEVMDTVKIGEKIIFPNVGIHATSDFQKIARGQYAVTFISKSKQYFYSSVFIPGNGGGSRTIQIDAARQISILEE